MSRNLCRSHCCDNTVRLSDMRGKPIEFRRYGSYAPHIGCRWDCPTCGTAYFAWWRDGDAYPSPPSFVIDLAYYESFNDEHDVDENKMAELLGLDRTTCSWNDLYKAWDEKFPNRSLPIANLDKPRHLCVDDAEGVQQVWGHKENSEEV